MSEIDEIAAAHALSRDPRTGLEIIGVPAQHQKYFEPLQDSVLHWFGLVEKYNHKWKTQKRIGIITDACIYLCMLDGAITRCVPVHTITELISSDSVVIGFRVAPPDYDLLISVGTEEERDKVKTILEAIYWATLGEHLPVKKVGDGSDESLQHLLQLNKPQDWVTKVEPIKKKRALVRQLRERQHKEEQDRKVVQQEFERIKAGLRHELQRHRSEEYDRMVAQLQQYTRALEAKDHEIARLKQNSISVDDPTLWEKCPNCVLLRRALEAHPSDDKQRIVRLERELHSQQSIVDHLQKAVQHHVKQGGRRGDDSGASPGGGGGSTADNVAEIAMKYELKEVYAKMRELEHIIVDSPYMEDDAKLRAQRICASHSLESNAAESRLQKVLHEKEKEIVHLKGLLRESSGRHVTDLERIRQAFRTYDTHIVEYLSRVLQSGGGSGGGILSGSRATTKEEAREAAGQLLRAAQNETFGRDAARGPSGSPEVGSVGLARYHPAMEPYSPTSNTGQNPPPYLAGQMSSARDPREGLYRSPA